MKDLLGVIDEALSRLESCGPLGNYYSFYMNRTAVYVNYWIELIALTCDGTGLWLEWDMCLDPVSTQVYLLHYEPEDWPI